MRPFVLRALLALSLSGLISYQAAALDRAPPAQASGPLKIVGPGSTGDLSQTSVTAAGASSGQTLGGWFSSIVFGTPTVSSLRGFSTFFVAPGSTLYASGYYTQGDGGGGLFTWSNTSTADDDGGGTIKPTTITGAGRWLRILSGPRTFRQWGMRGDGVTSDATQWFRLLAASIFGGHVYGECGSSDIDSATSIGVAAGRKIRVQGASNGCTELYHKGVTGSGLTVNPYDKYAGLDLSDVAFTTDGAGGPAGITVNNPIGDLDPASQPKKYITRVVFRGHTGILNGQYWSKDFVSFRTSNIDFEGNGFYGFNGGAGHVGVFTSGTDGTDCGGGPCYAAGFAFRDNVFSNAFAGIQAGTYSQGYRVEGGDFVVGSYGFYAPTGLQGLDLIDIGGGAHFNLSTAGVAIFSTAYGVNVHDTNHVIYNPGYAAVRLATPNCKIHDNLFMGNGGDNLAAVDLLQNATYCSVTGNIGKGLTIGVNLRSGATNNTVASNTWGGIYPNSGVTYPVVDGGANNTVLDALDGRIGQTKAVTAAPTPSTLGAGYYGAFKNSGDGSLKFCANDGGTIKCAAMQ